MDPKQRWDQVPAGSKHHLLIIIHPPYLCILESVKMKIRYLKALLYTSSEAIKSEFRNGHIVGINEVMIPSIDF